MTRSLVFGALGLVVGAAIGSLSTVHFARSAYGSPADIQARQFALVAMSVTDADDVVPHELVEKRAFEMLSGQLVLIAPYFDDISDAGLKAKVLKVASNQSVNRALAGDDSRIAAQCIAESRKRPVRECLREKAISGDGGG